MKNSTFALLAFCAFCLVLFGCSNAQVASQTTKTTTSQSAIISQETTSTTASDATINQAATNQTQSSQAISTPQQNAASQQGRASQSSSAPKEPAASNSSNPTAIANPASVKCVQDGGADKIVMGPNGEEGLCLFPDGTVCEEWAYMRGECKKGDCKRKCDFIGSRNEGWYDCNGKLLFWDNCTSENATNAATC